MKSLYFLVPLFLFVGCGTESSIIFENANIINVETGEISNYSLLIEGNKIVAISKEKLTGNKRINLEGNFIMPSLWDMHVHLHGDRIKLKAFFNHGILGVRDLGAFKSNGIDSLVKWKNELNRNDASEIPHIEYSGYINNDTTCYEGHRNVTSFEELIESIRYLNEINSSFYKVHNCFPSQFLKKLDSLAKINDFFWGGHIPEGVDPLQYIKKFDKINSIEHISVLLRALSFRNNDPLDMLAGVELLDGAYLDSFALIMKEKNISFTPNLLSEVEFIKSYPDNKKELGEGLLKRLRGYTKRISIHGVNILAGTDAGIGFEAGKSLFQELELLSQAGLSNLEVLQSTTINADKAIGRKPNLILENSKANFIILQENPLNDLTGLQSITGIVHNGNFKKLMVTY